MTQKAPKTNLTDAEIRSIVDQTMTQALGGAGRAVARAGLGTLVLVLAVIASTEAKAVGLILLCGALILGLIAYIRFVARSTPGAAPVPRTETRQGKRFSDRGLLDLASPTGLLGRQNRFARPRASRR